MSSGSQRGSRSRPQSQPPEEVAPRRAARWGGLAIVLGALAGIAVCAVVFGGLYLVNGRAASPDGAAQALCADLQAQNYAAAYGMLAPALQHEGTAQQFALSQQQLDGIKGKVTACVYTITSADSAQSSVTLTVTRALGGSMSGAVHFQYLGNAWKVDSYDTSAV